MIENSEYSHPENLQFNAQAGISYRGYEYRSQRELFGLPLVHIAKGFDPVTGRLRVAKGIIAIGNLAIGLLAVGGVAVGGIAVGGASLGIIAIGGIALGLLIALGGMSLGVLMAIGGIAISFQYAIGTLAIGLHPLGVYALTPGLFRYIEHFLQSLPEIFQSIRR